MSDAAVHPGRQWRTLRSSRDIRRVMTRGNRWTGGFVVVYAAPDGAHTRAGFATPRAMGGAVARNRARRVMKEAWRAVASDTAEGYGLMIVARPQIREAKAQRVADDLRSVLRSAGVVP